MSEKIRILQLGNEDWNECFKVPDNLELEWSLCFDKDVKGTYDLVFIDRLVLENELELLNKATKAYTLFVTDKIVLTKAMKHFYTCKKGKKISESKIQEFLDAEARNYFSKPYGEKQGLMNVSIAQGFSGKVSWNGNASVCVEGDFGETFNQIAYWRNNIPIYEGQAIDFWLEYEKDPDVEIAMEITQFKGGSISEVQQKWYFTETDLDNIVTADNKLPTGPIFVSILAKGTGRLSIIALHDRFSRRGHGLFLPGGKRYVTSKREEIFYYFDPMDMKPPLNVYFSGYKTQQGFEGYYLMRDLGCPFLLIAEPRLEGGGFYMGNAEYEKGFVSIIRKCMKELGFSPEQVVLSGLSMGSFGALYYGCDIHPHAMLVGKPLASIGDVAVNERLYRPGGFPTSLDVLKFVSGGMNEQSVTTLNDKFWDKFDRTDWGKSKFIVSYMLEDDYDGKAYDMLISHLKTAGVQIYGKGIHGRHNDATSDIVVWFRSQFDKILYEDFGRG